MTTTAAISVSTVAYDGHGLDRACESLARIGATHVEPAFLGTFDDRGGQRVLAASFETGGKAQHVVLSDGPGWNDANHSRLAFGQGSGLVDD